MTVRGVPNIPKPYFIRRNDTLPPYQVDVFDTDGEPVDLAGASSVLFSMRGPGNDQMLQVNQQTAETVIGPDGTTENRLEYEWQSGDTDRSGTFSAQFEATFAGGKRTFPPASAQALKIVVSDDWEDE